MAELSKVDNLAYGDIAKLIEIAAADIAKVYGLEWPAGVGSGDRGVYAGGISFTNVIAYITISSPSNATNFGDLTSTRYGSGAVSNGANNRGVFGAGKSSNIMEYITISSEGDATDFGDLLIDGTNAAGVSNGTNERGCFALDAGTGNVIEYITISILSNAVDFGDLVRDRDFLASADNGTNDRGLFIGTNVAVTGREIDYITISSTGNAIDFGDLTIDIFKHDGTSNGTNDRGIFGGGTPDGANDTDVIDYVTISSTGDATDFGNLTLSRSHTNACSNGTNERGVWIQGYDYDLTVGVNIMDYVTINSTGNASDFGDATEERYNGAATSNA